MLSKRPIVFALGLCLVCSFLLTFAASSLKPIQVKNQMVDKQKNILKVLNITTPGKVYSNDEVESLYKTYVKSNEEKGPPVCPELAPLTVSIISAFN